MSQEAIWWTFMSILCALLFPAAVELALDGGCPKAKGGKFLYARWRGRHKMSYTVRRWGAPEWGKFERNGKCEACGCKTHSFGLTYQDMLDYGRSPEDLDALEEDM